MRFIFLLRGLEEGTSRLQQIEAYIIELTLLVLLTIVCVHVLISHFKALFRRKD